MKMCCHCHRKKANRPRGLCWSCYYRPGVRDLYPSTSIFTVRGSFDHGNGPGEPTEAPAGSEEKIVALQERAAKGQDLYHPADSLRLVERALGRRSARPCRF